HRLTRVRTRVREFRYIDPMNFLVRILVTGLVAFALSKVLSGIQIDSFLTAIVFALVLAVLNVLVKPLLIILTLPLTILTLGLFLFVVNTLVVLLAGKLIDGVSIASFWWGLLFALLLSLITSFINTQVENEKKRS